MVSMCNYVSLCTIVCHCLPLCVTVCHYVPLLCHSVLLRVTVCHCHCEILPPNYWADYASLGECTPTLYVLRNKKAGKFPTKNFDLFSRVYGSSPTFISFAFLGRNISFLVNFFSPLFTFPSLRPNIFLIQLFSSLFLLRVNIFLRQ